MPDNLRRFKASVFQALAHPTRIAIVEYLTSGDLSVGQLCEKVGIEQANASQHLAVLRNKHVVQTRKLGNQIFYSLRDPVFGNVLVALRDFYLSHISEALELLRAEQADAERPAAERISGRSERGRSRSGDGIGSRKSGRRR
jgi:DNA-binding transcriptional ArsR family regulator